VFKLIIKTGFLSDNVRKIIWKEKTEQWKKLCEERQKAFRDANRQGRREVPRRR
jgi:hypothetical protein